MVRTHKKQESSRERKITYFKKESGACPVCDHPFQREELFQGRVNAGALTEELHREYTPMAAYGEVFPLVYPVTVCPNCYYSAFPADFPLAAKKPKKPLFEGISARIDSVANLFPTGLDFTSPRRLMEGAASYYLALQCYETFPDSASPVIKQGQCALRAAWLFKDLHDRLPGQNYDYIATVLYRKATFLYQRSLELDTRGKQALSSVKFLGPDSDTNYGYDGVIYVSGILELRYGQREDPLARDKKLDYLACAIAKMFGLGKKTKAKPGPLLEKARDLYDLIKAEIKRDPLED